MKKKNLFVIFDIFSIVFLVFLLLYDFLVSKNVISLKYIGDTLYHVINDYRNFHIASVAFMGVMIFGNLAIIIINDKNLKSILLRLLNIILLGFIIFTKFNYDDIYDRFFSFWLVIIPKICLIGILVYQIVNEKNNEKESKFLKVFVIIYLILLIVSISFGLLFICKLKIYDNRMDNFIDVLEYQSYYQEKIIPVKKNGKWGCINDKGKLVVECKYDNMATPMHGGSNEAFFCKLVIAQKDDEFIYINGKGEEVLKLNDYPLPFNKDTIEGTSWDDFQGYVFSASQSLQESIPDLFYNIKDDEEKYVSVESVYDDFNYSLGCDLGSEYSLELVEAGKDKEDNNLYDITYKHNGTLFHLEKVYLNEGKEVSTYKGIQLNNYNDLIFTNRNDTFGYINIKTKEYLICHGKANWPETSDKYLYYCDESEDMMIVKDKKTGNFKDIYNSIYETSDGFIVSNKDEIESLVDNDFNMIIKDFDDIRKIYKCDDLYICKKDNKSSVYNTKGEKITNDYYQEIGQ